MKRIATAFSAGSLMLLISISAYAEYYTILIDAGSSGSRLRLFQYDSQLSLPDIKSISLKTKEVKPGLSSFASQPEAAGPSLEPLLDEVVEALRLKSIQLDTVNLHILASAGMRLLPQEQQEKIYAHIKDYLKKKYAFSIGEIKTIDGKMEGIYGWLTVNYLQKTFLLKSPSVGSIDMGGASTQIAFATLDSSPSPDKVPLIINQQPYFVFSKSFLGLGQDKIRESMNKHPEAESCYPEGYELEPSRKGLFNAQKCSSIYKQLIQAQEVKKHLIAFSQGHFFVAYSGIFYAYDFFKANLNQPLENRISAVCNKKWNDLQNDYSGNKYLFSYCANGVYINELLRNTYQIPDIQMVATNKINQQDIDWTLGALLHQLVEKNIHWTQQQIEVKNITHSGALITWQPAVSAQTLTYDVQVNGPGGKVYSNIKKNSHYVEGLQPGSTYTVLVTANNGNNQVMSETTSFNTSSAQVQPLPHHDPAAHQALMQLWTIHHMNMWHAMHPHPVANHSRGFSKVFRGIRGFARRLFRSKRH